MSQSGSPVPSWRASARGLQTAWHAAAVALAMCSSCAPARESLPKIGEFVYVEELPEIIERVGPVYPKAALRAGIDGQVHVRALVLKDGSVGDVRIDKSIPELDRSAVDCVRKWRFKPAMAKGQPVAVWVGIPIKFSK